MKKINFYPLMIFLLVFCLFFNNCSKETIEPLADENVIVIKPSVIGGIRNEGAAIRKRSPNSFVKPGLNKSAEGYQVSACEVYSPRLSASSVFTNNGAKVIYIDNYNQPNDDYTGYYEYSYDANADISVKYRFDRDWNLMGYCTYYYISRMPTLLIYIAKWDASGNFLGYLHFTRDVPKKIIQVEEYNANYQLVQNIAFVYNSSGNLTRITFGNGDTRSYTYNSSGQVSTATISETGYGYSMIYYSRSSNTWTESSYLFGQYSEYDKYYHINSSYSLYDPWEPLNIYNLDFLNL